MLVPWRVHQPVKFKIIMAALEGSLCKPEFHVDGLRLLVLNTAH